MRSIIKMCTISISGLSQGLGIETKRILYQKVINLKGDSSMSTFSKQRLEFFGYARETFTRRLRMALQFFLQPSLFAKPCWRYQPSRANSKISYKVSNWFAPPSLRRDWAFIPCSGDDFRLIWLPPSRYSRAFWILIRTCFYFLPPDAA